MIVWFSLTILAGLSIATAKCSYESATQLSANNLVGAMIHGLRSVAGYMARFDQIGAMHAHELVDRKRERVEASVDGGEVLLGQAAHLCELLGERVEPVPDHGEIFVGEAVLALGEPPGGAGVAGRPLDPAQDLTGAYARAVNSIRHHLAIDSLTTGMLKEMGIGSESVAVKNPRSGLNPLVPVGRTAN